MDARARQHNDKLGTALTLGDSMRRRIASTLLKLATRIDHRYVGERAVVIGPFYRVPMVLADLELAEWLDARDHRGSDKVEAA